MRCEFVYLTASWIYFADYDAGTNSANFCSKILLQPLTGADAAQIRHVSTFFPFH